MGLIKRLAGYVLLVCALVFGVLFSIQNTARVPLDLLFVRINDGSVAAWVIWAFVCGGLVGVIVSAVALFTMKSRVSLLLRRVDKLNRELDSLRTAELRSTVASGRKSKSVPSGKGVQLKGQ